MSTHKDNSSVRYFLAGLKPLGRPLFWAPLGLFSLALIFYWQYNQQPALLNRTIDEDQPQQNLDRVVNGEPDMTQVPLNDLVSTDINDLQAQQAAKANQKKAQQAPQLNPNQVWRFNQPNQNTKNKNNNASSLFSPLVQNNQSGSNSNSSLFVPLMPQIRQNSQANNTRTPLQPIEVTPPSSSTRQSALQSAMNNLPTSGYNTPRYNNSGNSPTPANSYNTGGAPAPNYQPNYAQNRYYQPNSPYSTPSGQNQGNYNSSSSNPAPSNVYQDGYQGGYGQSQPQTAPTYNNPPRYGVQPAAMQPGGGF